MIQDLIENVKLTPQEQNMAAETKHKRITKDSHVSEILDTLPLIYQHVFTETQKLTKNRYFY